MGAKIDGDGKSAIDQSTNGVVQLSPYEENED
jgi:hypothetical protein